MLQSIEKSPSPNHSWLLLNLLLTVRRLSLGGDSTTIPTSDFKNGVDGGATHLPSWKLLERTTALGDDERDVIELGAGGELLDLFHNRGD
jgi:hypothetical protein